MLTIKCAACKRKLWKYDKIGKGQVLRCHKARMMREYEYDVGEDGKVVCVCGRQIGIDKGAFIKMIAKAFIYTGTKRTG